MINEYQVHMRVKSDRDQLARRIRDAQFVEDALGIEKAQPKRLRFHFFRLHLPRFSGFGFFRFFRLNRIFRLRRQQDCTHAPLNAH